MATTKVTSGGITDATVSTADIANDAVTSDKIADDAIQSEHYGGTSIDTEHIANGAITGPKIAGNTVGTSNLQDQAVTLAKLPHGTSSNDGKFLRANNGADPTFETVTGTTINNNAVNRVITGSGTANTLNGQSGFTVNTSNNVLSAGGGFGIQNVSGTISGSGGGQDYISIKDSGNTERVVIKTHGTNIGKVGIGMNNPDDTLDVNGTFHVHSNSYFGGDIYAYGDIRIGGTGTGNALDDYEEGTWSPGINTGTASFGTAYYTKIGRFVNATVFVSQMSPRTANYGIEITGLPFQANGTFTAPLGLHRVIGDQGNGYFAYLSDNTTSLSLLQYPWSQQGWKSLNHNQIQHATAAYIIITISYQTD